MNGKIATLSIGSKIPKSDIRNRLQLVKRQEGDIPALYRIRLGGLEYEITCINKVIVGISLKLSDYPNKSFKLFIRNRSSINFGFNSNLVDLITYLNDTKTDWYFYTKDSDEKSIGLHLTKSRLNILYSFNSEYTCCYRIYAFDWMLYEKLAKAK